MDKIKAKYTKEELPEALKGFAVETNGEFVISFDDDVAAVTNPSLAANRDKLLGEKRDVQTKYDTLLASSGDISREVIELRNKLASGGQITADELAVLNAVKGKVSGTPEEIAQQLEQLPTLQAKVKTYEDGNLNREIADIMKWKPNIFGELRNHPEKAKDLSFEIGEITENGVTTKKAYVSTKNAEGVVEKKELGDFVKSNSSWNEYLPSLQTETKTGPQWVAQQTAGGTGSVANSLDAHIQNKNAQAAAAQNPLLPNKKPVTPAGQGTA